MNFENDIAQIFASINSPEHLVRATLHVCLFFCKMCRPCALHPRQSLIALNVCRAWRLWWRDIPWRLLRWMLLKQNKWRYYTAVFCIVLEEVHFSLVIVHCSMTAVFAFHSGRFMHQSAALRPPEVRCLKEEMVHGHGCTMMYMDMVGSNRYFAIVNYWYWCAQFQTSWRLPSTSVPHTVWGQIEKQLLAQPDPDPQLEPLEDG